MLCRATVVSRLVEPKERWVRAHSSELHMKMNSQFKRYFRFFLHSSAKLLVTVVVTVLLYSLELLTFHGLRTHF